MMNSIDQQIADQLNQNHRILITSHVRPDADAVGSVLAIGLALKNAGKYVQMVLEDDTAGFEYLPKIQLVKQVPDGDVDLAIVLDCSDLNRVGHVLNDYGKPDLVVDHHKTNLNFGINNIVEPEQVATAEILFDHLPKWGLTIDQDVATCLLAGIVGDTIGFRTSNVNSATMRRTAELMDFGADLARIYREELVLQSYKAVRYWGAGLIRLQHENGIIWTSLTLDDRQDIGYPGNGDADLVNILSSVREAEIALIFVEQSQNDVKISWRARPGLDVSGIATFLGGGGHAAAAGADVKGSLENVQKRVILLTKKLLEQRKSE
ncbi:MAG: DHH family phosphoesterase [Chloroflexota bacterium]|nr:DHH family phosphoesterase [Chloroflexota bacterium]